MSRDCTSLHQVREEIDRLDDAILDLLVERGGYVRQAVGLKQRQQIVDPVRIDAILARVRARAEASGLAPDIAAAVWQAMIDAFIAYEEAIYDEVHKDNMAGNNVKKDP